MIWTLPDQANTRGSREDSLHNQQRQMEISFTSFGINLGPVLGKVLASCHNFALNYMDNIVIFSRTWEDHLRHLEEVFKQLKHADLKIKCNKCKFFKSQVHYLGYHGRCGWSSTITGKAGSHQEIINTYQHG